MQWPWIPHHRDRSYAAAQAGLNDKYGGGVGGDLPINQPGQTPNFNALGQNANIQLQDTLKLYRNLGMVPNATLFKSTSNDTLKVLFEYRHPDAQVGAEGLGEGGGFICSEGSHHLWSPALPQRLPCA